MDVSWIRQGLPSVYFVMLDILKTVFNPRPVNRVALLNTKIKQGQLHVKAVQMVGTLIRRLLPFAKAVSQVNFKTKLDKQGVKTAPQANIKIMAPELIVSIAILVITALVGRLFVRRVLKGTTKISMAKQIVSLVVQENFKIKHPQKTAKVVLLVSTVTKTHSPVVKIAQVDNIRIKTVKQIAKTVVQEFILLVDLLLAQIAQLGNIKMQTNNHRAKVVMEARTNGITRQVKLPLAVDAENVKEQIQIMTDMEPVVATWRGTVLQTRIETLTISYTHRM